MNRLPSQSRSRISETTQRMIIYPTLSKEDQIIQRSQLLSLYQKYVKSKENLQYVDYYDPAPKPIQNVQKLQELNIEAPSKTYILKTQMRKYRNMQLYDKKKLSEARSSFSQPKRQSCEHLNYGSEKYQLIPESKQIPRKRSYQSVNMYEGSLLKIAKNPNYDKINNDQVSPLKLQQTQSYLLQKLSQQSRLKKYIAVPNILKEVEKLPPRVPTFRGWENIPQTDRSFAANDQ